MHPLSFDDFDFGPGTELKVFIDGTLIDTVTIPEQAPAVGDTIESPAITAALGDRPINDVSFIGTMVMVTTGHQILTEL
jgi:hypothetical protein